jgi:hypothetical protein
LENQERAFIAASRRQDRSIDARVISARQASDIHRKRTGKGFKITEEIVLKEEMYEEEDDDLIRAYRTMASLPPHLRAQSPAMRQRVSAFLDVKIAAANAVVGVDNHDTWEQSNPINQAFAAAFPEHEMRRRASLAQQAEQLRLRQEQQQQQQQQNAELGLQQSYAHNIDMAQYQPVTYENYQSAQYINPRQSQQPQLQIRTQFSPQQHHLASPLSQVPDVKDMEATSLSPLGALSPADLQQVRWQSPIPGDGGVGAASQAWSFLAPSVSPLSSPTLSPLSSRSTAQADTPQSPQSAASFAAAPGATFSPLSQAMLPSNPCSPFTATLPAEVAGMFHPGSEVPDIYAMYDSPPTTSEMNLMNEMLRQQSQQGMADTISLAGNTPPVSLPAATDSAIHFTGTLQPASHMNINLNFYSGDSPQTHGTNSSSSPAGRGFVDSPESVDFTGDELSWDTFLNYD